METICQIPVFKGFGAGKKRDPNGKENSGEFWAVLLQPVPRRRFILSQASFSCYSPDIPFLWLDSSAAWIRYPSPLSGLYPGLRGSEAIFRKIFSCQNERSEQIFIHLKSFGRAELWVNEFPDSAGVHRENWKEGSRGQISPWLKQGANTIRVMVNNPLGPALLWMKVEGLDPPVRTDETWKVRFESDPYVQAILADDTRANPESLSIPTPLQSLSQKWVSLLLILGLTIVLFGAAPLFRKIGERESLPRIALLAIFGMWVYLFGEKMVKIGPGAGFDVGNHLAYIFYIFQNQRIPLPTEGWSMFHPPFFYLLSAGFLQIMGSFYSWDNLFPFLKIIPLLCGMGNIWVSYSFLRLVFPDDRARILGGVILAGFLPMNIYISAYVGNEPLHAFLAGCSLVIAVHILRSSEVRSPHMIYLGLLLGLAMLTKITAGALVPVVVIFLAYKMIRVDGKNLKEVASRLGLFILVMTVICGWYYIRNIIHFGRPFMINWDLPGQRWWQDPGFHTVQYYLSFGEALRHPYFSAFHSFWDALYSTFWGDGLIGGKALFAETS